MIEVAISPPDPDLMLRINAESMAADIVNNHPKVKAAKERIAARLFREAKSARSAVSLPGFGRGGGGQAVGDTQDGAVGGAGPFNPLMGRNKNTAGGSRRQGSRG